MTFDLYSLTVMSISKTLNFVLFVCSFSNVMLFPMHICMV
jgi:hypothetical protein